VLVTESEDGGVAQSGRKSQTKKTTKKKAAKKTSSESQAKITVSRCCHFAVLILC